MPPLPPDQPEKAADPSPPLAKTAGRERAGPAPSSAWSPGGHRRLRRGWIEGLLVALRDLADDRKTSLVLMFTVAAIIAPVMLLFGLKNGVVATLIETLLNDPRTLQVTVYGNTHLDRAWFARTAVRPDTGFVVPRTRTINATLDLANRDGRLDAIECAAFLDRLRAEPEAQLVRMPGEGEEEPDDTHPDMRRRILFLADALPLTD